MDQRIVIRHMNASKANQTEEFQVKDNLEIMVGREAECKVRYDSERDDLVSRRHAKVVVEKTDPVEVVIWDLGSSNGTFVNKQRLFSKVRLNPGDLVQLGPGGPEFQFDLNPRPVAAKATRLADAVSAPIPATREVPLAPAVTASAAAGANGRAANPPAYTPSGSTVVGKATVERMITQNKNQQRNVLIAAGLAMLAVIGGVSGYLLTRPKPHPQIIATTVVKAGTDGIGSEQIASSSTPSVVYIENAWSLIDSHNGRTLSQVYVPNFEGKKNGKDVLWIQNLDKRTMLPVFFQLNGNVEPILSTEDGGGQFVTVGGGGRGSGFVVSNDGFILTNRHVAQGWETRYDYWMEHQVPAGILIAPGSKGPSISVISANQFPSWVPAHAKVISEGKFSLDNLKPSFDELGFAREVQGRDDVLNVTFAGNRIRIPAKVARSSDRADVSMIKVDLPRSLPKIELNDNYDSIQPGARVVVMGYPGVTPNTIQVTRSTDIMNSADIAETIPNPTVTDGNVGQILRNGANNNLEQGTYSGYGDYYQLQINTTGAGNSGGPVFDAQGRVIGLFTLTRNIANASVTYAVPIRYGMELMGVNVASK